VTDGQLTDDKNPDPAKRGHLGRRRAEEAVMNKLIAVAALVLVFLIEPALGRVTNIHPRASGAQKEQKEQKKQKKQKEQSTPASGSDRRCKTYFALINEVVGVPCTRNPPEPPARVERCQKYFSAVGQLVDVPCGG
jgi:hypothetical protein